MNTSMWLLVLLEPIFTYLRARRGVKRHHRNYDFYDYNNQTGARPSKLIKNHFALVNGAIPVVIYRRYIMTYIFFIRIFVLYAIAFLLRFNFPRYCTIWLLTTIVLFLITLPIIIKEISVEHKSNRERKKHKKKKKLIDDLQDDIQFIKEMRQYNAEIKALKWITPLIKELDYCTRKKKGKKYIPWDNVNYAEKSILSKYQKYVYHQLILNEQGKRSLAVYAKKDHQLIYQADIKK